MTYRYFNNCMNWDLADVDTDGGLNDLIEGIKLITRRTFLKHADRMDLIGVEQNLSYFSHHKQGLTMAGDWHVAYFKSKLHGKLVYGFVHSAIEYVFVKGEVETAAPTPTRRYRHHSPF